MIRRRSRPWLLLLALAAQPVAAACSRESAAPQAPADAPQHLLAAGSVASAAAFDLVNQQGEVFLAFAPLRAKDGAVVLRRLDRLGRARGTAQVIVRATAAPAAEVTELALAATGSQLALVFTEHDPSGFRTRALLFAPGAQPDAPELLSTAALSLPRSRGHVAIAAAANGRARVLYLSGEAECLDRDQAPCFGFAFHELGAGEGGPRRPWLSVPQPCSEGAASLASRPGHFYYAICSAAQEPAVTTAYAISIDPEYARADAVLRGCSPLGITPIDADTLLLGADCNGVRRVARLAAATQPAAEFPLVDAALTCDGDRMQLSALGFSLKLGAAQDRLEAVLPAAIAPAGSRAVHTGRALLVAQRMSEQLVLRSYVCDAGRLQVHSSIRVPATHRE